jgi:hypothetical protein
MKNNGTGMNYVALRQAIQGKLLMFGGYNNDDDEDNNDRGRVGPSRRARSNRETHLSAALDRRQLAALFALGVASICGPVCA